MTLDYKFKCTACDYTWEVYGDGCFQPPDPEEFDQRCKCGCQVLHVTDLSTADTKKYQKDFTESNNARIARINAEKSAFESRKESRFVELQWAFYNLSRFDINSDGYKSWKNWIMERL